MQDEKEGPEGTVSVSRLVISLLLILLTTGFFLWSKDGGLSTIEMTVSENQCSYSFDGILVNEVQIPETSDGGIGYYQYRFMVPSIPHPQTIRSIQMVDLDTGEYVLDVDFTSEHFDKKVWDVMGDTWRFEDGGVTRSPLEGAIFAFRPVRNMTVKLVVGNLNSGQLYLRARSPQDYVGCFFRPFRDFDSRIFVQENSKKVYESQNRTPLLSPRETVKRTTDLIFHHWPQMLPLFAACVALIFVLCLLCAGLAGLWTRASRIFARWKSLGSVMNRPARATFAALILCALTFTWLLRVTDVFLDRVPHVQDSAVMLFQAKTLASGRISVPAPAIPGPFSIKGFMHVKNGRLFGQYPFGYPLFLALGVVTGKTWMIPAVAGTLLVFATFLLGRRIMSAWWGVLAASLLACSPFFQMTAPNFMSHTVASLYCIVSLLLFLKIEDDRSRFLVPLSGGLMLGLLLNTRPMTAAALAFAFVLMSFVVLIQSRQRGRLVLRLCVFAGAAGLMVGVFLLYNAVLMGEPFAFTYGATAKKVTDSAFDYARLSKACLDNFTLSALFLMVLMGWSSLLTTVPLLGMTLPDGRSKRDAFFLIILVMSVFVAYMFYSISSVTVMYGPRYVAEILSPVIVLLVFGIRTIIGSAFALARRLVIPFFRGVRFQQCVNNPGVFGVPRAILTILVVLFFLLHGVMSFVTWTTKDSRPWPGNVFVPQNVQELKGFNHITPRVQQLVAEKNIHNAVVFVGSDPGRGAHWWHYGSVFFENSPTFDDDVVYAWDIGDPSTYEIMKLYPGRAFYRANYERNTLWKVEPAELESSED